MESSRIELIKCNEKLLQLILKGDQHLAEELNVNLADRWSEYGKEIFEITLEMIQENPEQSKWFLYFPVIKNTRTLIGTCGFKGAPDEEGVVEIGFEVSEDFRNQGYATEMAGLLVDKAFKDESMKKILAHTLAMENASVKVLKKCEFRFVEECQDEEDGQLWRWEKTSTS